MSRCVLSQSAMLRPVNLWAIIAWLAVLLAAAVQMLAPPRPAEMSNSSLIFFVADKFEAVSSFAHGTKPGSIPLNPPFGNDQDGQLFGMEAEPVAIGALSEKWRQLQGAIAKDTAILAQCRANGPCPLAAQRLIDISAKGAGQTGRARVGLINRAADLAISPISDQVQWGAADHWSDPLETLRSSRGDCEDYAIVKYAALLDAGIPKNDVKIVILKNLFPNEDHAAVAARVDNQWLILDNRTLTLVHDTDVTRAIPEFVLDHEGVKRFKWASRNWRGAAEP